MKTIFNIFLGLLLTFESFAQNVGINSTGTAPDNSAMLDVVSTDKGMLVPRVNIIDLNTAAPVTAPATSLLVYNTNTTSGVGYYFWDGTKWINLKDANSNADEDWYKVGGTTAPTNINDNIFTQGNVGVGIVNPNIKFVVAEGNSNLSIALEGFSSSYPGLPTILPASGSHFGGIVHGGTDGQLILGIRENDVNDGLLIASGGGNYMSDNTYDKAILFARNDGNVGINTTTPSQKLDVTGGAIIRSANTSYFWTERPDSDFDMIQSTTSTKRSLSIHASSSGSDVLAVYANNGSFVPALHIKNTTGNVGMGTQTPSQKLNVIGNILASGTITSSDVRYKQDIKSLENSSEIIKALNPVSYHFKEEYIEKGQFDDKLHFGVIAQDLEKVLPNLVYEDNEGFKAVNYTEIIALLIKSNQELQKRIEELEKD